ncbi:MAG: hypothetical protein HC802_00735 [Caldilineaceae bacterium]|nr:hypothetical protein [Caldilineaceae bacterium]
MSGGAEAHRCAWRIFALHSRVWLGRRASARVAQSLRQWHLSTARVIDAWEVTRGRIDICLT